VPKRSKHAAGLADPTRLPPFKSKNADLTVIIETPKGSRNKYAYSPEEGIFELRKVLPAGMAFPYDFGLVIRDGRIRVWSDGVMTVRQFEP
jgi:inorganic pyrophosphatase